MSFLHRSDPVKVDIRVLGQKIREARELIALSQEEFADLVDKDQTAISDYENGKRKVSITELPKFAEVLHVPIVYFFEDDITPDELDRTLLAEFHKLPDTVKREAIDVMRSLVGISKKSG